MASKKVVPTKPYRPITEARKKAFLEELARHGVVAQAARVATPHETKTTGASGFYRLRSLDPEFAEAWDAAVEQADAALLTEARRRAVEGVERGIFQKGTQATTADGKPATERVYSDRLLELVLKARFPNEFIERRAIEHRQGPTGWVITTQDIRSLSPEQRRQLSAIVATVQAARGEAIEDRSAVDAEYEVIDDAPEEWELAYEEVNE